MLSTSPVVAQRHVDIVRFLKVTEISPVHTVVDVLLLMQRRLVFWHLECAMPDSSDVKGDSDPEVVSVLLSRVMESVHSRFFSCGVSRGNLDIISLSRHSVCAVEVGALHTGTGSRRPPP